jgi:4-aminobutyrate aminotransferase
MVITLNVPGPNARRIIERDKGVISASYPRSYPFVMDHGKGCRVWDVDGNCFLDFAAGIAVASTGHSHPQVVHAIQEQAERFIHISSDFYHEKWVRVAEKLDQIAPFAEPALSFMTNSGTESIESAIKLARFHTGRSQFIGFLGGFHGRTMGALSFTASKNHYHHGFYPLMNGAIHVPYPDPYRPVLQSLPGEPNGKTVVRYIEEQILEKLVPPEEVAGILVEPIQGEGGYVVPAEGFFPALRALCDRYGILLIVDEVQSGVGRTGKWWAVEHFGVEPDILCTAKGIASGVPMGAMIARQSVMDWPKGAHGNTFGGNPLACAASLVTLELIEQQYLANATTTGAFIQEKLAQMATRHPSIGQVRGLGMMIGVEFVQDPASRQPDEDLRDRMIDLAFERGLLLLGCGQSVVRIAPPLCITPEEAEQGLEIFEEALQQAEDHVRTPAT